MKLLSAAEERALGRRIQGGDRAALHTLVERNLRLVAAEARRRHGVPYGDLFQEGVLGLIRAAERFDPERGVHFATYALEWVRRAMDDAVRRAATPLSVSTRDARRLYRLRAVDGGRDADVAAALEVPVARLPWLRAAAAPVASLEAVVAPADEPPLWREVLRRQVTREVGRAVDALPAREREVVRRRHGAGETLAAIARDLGVSAERARQLESRALARLAEDPGLRALADAA
jgi:RNA polymerase sigma factor (sigma-70 family)